MELGAFVSRCERYCRNYFDSVQVALARGGQLMDVDGRPVQPMYPTMLIIFETPTHFAAELVGAAVEFKLGLKVVQRRLPSIQSYLGHFPADNSTSLLRFSDSGGANELSHLAVMCARDSAVFEARYPELGDLHESTLIYSGQLFDDQAFHAFDLPSSFQDLWLNDVLTVSNWHSQVRARYFQASWIIERSASSSELKRRLEERHPVLSDTSLLAPSAASGRGPLLAAANFSSLASVDKIGETTITAFLDQNEDLLLTALGGASLIAQPLLPWIEGNPDPEEEAIQPDFLLVDRFGTVHLCEVKLPLLSRTTLTTGGHRRRRFASAVTDGIAQLFNYLDYLQRDAHQRLLRDRYGVSVSEPRLILLVGSAENYDTQEVAEAQRMHKKFELLDYDTIRALYLAASGYIPNIGSR